MRARFRFASYSPFLHLPTVASSRPPLREGATPSLSLEPNSAMDTAVPSGGNVVLRGKETVSWTGRTIPSPLHGQSPMGPHPTLGASSPGQGRARRLAQSLEGPTPLFPKIKGCLHCRVTAKSRRGIRLLSPEAAG